MAAVFGQLVGGRSGRLARFLEVNGDGRFGWKGTGRSSLTKIPPYPRGARGGVDENTPAQAA